MADNSIFLLAVALFPAIALCIFIYKKDKHEKEPKSLLFTLLMMGVFICYPVLDVGEYLKEILDSFYLSSESLYNFIKYFFCVALVEEGFKWLAVLVVTKDNKHFNSVFDGMIYAIYVSLGFAGFENILYTMNHGLDVGLRRMLTAVPAHMFFAVFMGYYFSWYHMKKLTREHERKLKAIGGIPKNSVEFSPKKDLAMSLFIPVLAHGFYDYCAVTNTVLAFFTFYAFIIFMYIHCFLKVKKMSTKDMEDTKMAIVMLSNKYPSIRQVINEIFEKNELQGKHKTIITFETICDHIKFKQFLRLEGLFTAAISKAADTEESAEAEADSQAATETEAEDLNPVL